MMSDEDHSNIKLKEWQDKITAVSGSDTFCVLPWIHLATRPNGDARLCCVANSSGAGSGDHLKGLLKKENGQPANYGTDTPIEAWNGDFMKSARKTMLEGKIPESCTKCFAEERRGIASKRIWETGTWYYDGTDIKELIENTSEDGSVPENIRYLDLRLGHTCNLKCVMCSPHDSSLWVADHKKMYPEFQHPVLKHEMEWDRKSFNNFWHENPVFWEQIYAQIPNLRQLYFAGGEPLMIKEHKMFLEEIIRQGYAKNILVRYNSNAILLEDDIVELWKHFKQVKFGVSMDAIGDRLHYIRYPTDFSRVETVLDKLDNTPDNVQVSIACALQVLNIKHLPDFVKWKVNKNYKKINLGTVPGGTQMGGGIMNIHLVWIPTFLDMRILPEKDKQEIVEQFAELKDWLWKNYRQDDDFWKENPYGWKRYEALLSHLLSEDKSNLLTAFREYIKSLDRHRKLNFAQIFPELAHLLS